MKNRLTLGIFNVALIALMACSPKTAESNEAEPPLIEAEITADNTGNDQTFSENKVKKEKIPEWVNVPSLPEFPAHRNESIKNGLAYLATDYQVYLTNEGYRYFSRVAYKIVERNGLETAAQITKAFDPTLEELEFNYLHVIRNGKKQNRLETATIQELRREDNLTSGLVDGNITAMIQIEDIRVGDIIDYGYSGIVRTPLWQKHYFHNFAASYGVPLARESIEISIPNTTRLTTDNINGSPRPKITDEGDRTIYYYNIVDPEPNKTYSNVPNDIILYPYILISTMSSWEEVSEWAVNVYDVEMGLTADFKKKLKRIKRTHKKPEDRMIEVFRWVQSDIRYLGIESGINSHQPRAPKITLEKGYGDCKDKSSLLVSALRELGITAHSVLVSTSSGHMLPQLLPSITNFDHVIVLAEIDGKKYWLDPTLSYQGGKADNLAPLDYGYVLPIKAGAQNLVKIEVSEPKKPTSFITETYTLLENGGMNLDITSEYVSSDADSMRRKVVGQNKKNISKKYLDYYADLYPSISTSDDIDIIDNFDDNKLVINEHYYLTPEDYEINELADGIIVKASTLKDKLPRSLEADRDIKLALPVNLFLKHVIEIKTPGRKFSPPDDLSLEQSGIYFVRNYRSENETFFIEYELRVRKKVASLADARAVIELAEKINDESARTIYPKAAKESLTKRLELDFTLSDDIELKLEKVSSLLQKEKNIQALEILNDLEKTYIKKDPVRGYIQVLRAAILEGQNRNEAALPLFKEAFALYTPDTKGVFYTYASLLRENDKNLETIEIMRRLFEKHPDATTNVNYKWLWRLAGELYREEHFKEYESLIVALAAAQISHIHEINKADLAFGQAIPILGRNGDAEQAKAYLPYLSNPTDILYILIDKEQNSLWPELENVAGKGLSDAMAKYVVETSKIAAENMDDFKAKKRKLYAFMMAGKMEDALTLGAETVNNWSKIEAVGDEAYWFVIAYADALSYEGHNDEADALYNKLLAIGIENQPSLINVAIDYVGFLMMVGDFDKTLNQIDKYENMEQFDASDYGWMFLHQFKACAMTELGNKQDALALYNEKTEKITDTNIATHFMAQICMGELDAAEKTLINRLKTKKHREGALGVFTTASPRKVTSSYRAELMKRVRKVSERPKVQSVFKTYGRTFEIAGPAEVWEEY